MRGAGRREPPFSLLNPLCTTLHKRGSPATLLVCENGSVEPTGCGAAWLARLSGGQEVPGSNPGTPTALLKPKRPGWYRGVSPSIYHPSTGYYALLQSAGLTAVATSVYMVSPNVTAVANVAARDVLQPAWRVTVLGNGNPTSYTVAGSMIP
jgi:hypothetical protein